MRCEQASQIHAYHDGELPPAARDAVESHVAACAECRALLDDLRGMSRIFATVALREMPERAFGRMHGSWHKARAAQDRGVRRLAEWLTVAAAAVLAAVMFLSRLHQSDVNTHAQATISEDVVPIVAMLPPGEEASSELILAQWMANDLSLAERQ